MQQHNAFSPIRRAALSAIALLTSGLAVPSVTLADLTIGNFGGTSTGMSTGTNVLTPTAAVAQLDVTDFTLAVNYAFGIGAPNEGVVYIDTSGVGSGNVVLQAGQTLSFDHPTGAGYNVLRIDANNDASIYGHIVHNTTTGDPLHLTLSVDGSIYLDAAGSFELNEGSLSIEAGGSVNIQGYVSASGYDIYADGKITTPDIVTSGTVNLVQDFPVGPGLENGIETGSITTTSTDGNNEIQLYGNAVRVDGSINAGGLDLIHRGDSVGESFVVTGDINLANGYSGFTIETDGRVQVDGQINSQLESDTFITANGGMQLGNVTVGGNMRLLQPNPNGSGLAGGIQTGSLTLTGAEGFSALEIETSMPVYIDGDVSAGGLNSQPPDLSVDSDFTITGNVFLTEGTYNSLNIESGGDVEIGGNVTNATFFKIQANGGITTGDVTSNGQIEFEQPDPTGSGLAGGVQTGSLTGAPDGVVFRTGMPIQVDGSIEAGSVFLQGPISSGVGLPGEEGAVGFVMTGNITVTSSDPSPTTGIAGLFIDTLGSVQIDGAIDNQGGGAVEINADGAIRTGNITGGGNMSVSQYFPTGSGPDDGIHLGSITLSGNSLGNNSLQLSTSLPIFVDGPITADRVDIGPGNGEGYTGLTINGDVNVGELGEMNISHRGAVAINGTFTGRQLAIYNERDESSFESGSINASEWVDINVGQDVTISGDLVASEGSVRSNVDAEALGISTGESDMYVSGDVVAYRTVEFRQRNTFVGGTIQVTSDDVLNPQYPNRFESTGSGTFEAVGDITVQRGEISIQHEGGVTIHGSTSSVNGDLSIEGYDGPITTGDLTGVGVRVSGSFNEHAISIGNVTSESFEVQVNGSGDFSVGDVSATGTDIRIFGAETTQAQTGRLQTSGSLDVGATSSFTASAIDVGGEVNFEVRGDVTVNGSFQGGDTWWSVPGHTFVDGDFSADSLYADVGGVPDLYTGSSNGSLHVAGSMRVGNRFELRHNGNVNLVGGVDADAYFYSTNDGEFTSGPLSASNGVTVQALQAIVINGDVGIQGEGSISLSSTRNDQFSTLSLGGSLSAPQGYIELYVGGRVDLNDLTAIGIELYGPAEYHMRPGSLVQAESISIGDGSSLFADDTPLNVTNISVNSAILYATQIGQSGGSTSVLGTIVPQGASGPGAVALSILGDVTWYTNEGSLLRVEMVDAQGVAGSGWDLLDIEGLLQFEDSGSGAGLRVELSSLPSSGGPGTADQFDPDQSHIWTLLTADGGITGFDPNAVYLDLGGFVNSYTGVFSLQQDGNSINLVYTASIPEPAVLGVAALGAFALLRRRLRWHARCSEGSCRGQIAVKSTRCRTQLSMPAIQDSRVA